MYGEFFQFTQLPFGLTPNTALFCNQQSHREALNTLLVALKHREGFIKVVGEVGTGKTILCRKLLASLNNQLLTAYIPNPDLSPVELKAAVAEEIGIKLDRRLPAYKLMSAINRRLIELAKAGQPVVLIIDEAQAMPRQTIETLRLLTNLETESRKLLQVVLFGQPELDELLNRSDLRQLKQRIVFSEYLRPLNYRGTRLYVQHRLRAAGRDARLFSRGALRLLSWSSRGIPRLINILAHKSLLVAYGRGDTAIGIRHVLRAAHDTEETRGWFWRRSWLIPVLGGLSISGVVMADTLLGRLG